MKSKILFVEDERWGVMPYFRELENMGFDCQLAEDGDEAIKKLESQQFDIISMDVMFPPGRWLNKNTAPIRAGLKLLTMIRHGKIKNCPPDLKVIVLTAVISPQIEQEFKQLGVSAYLKKPVEFMKVIETFCEFKKNEAPS